MRKKLLLLLVCLLLACGTGAVLTASAGINTNSPVGDGLLSNGNINETNFAVVENLTGEEKTAVSLKKGNSTYEFIGCTSSYIVPLTQIPKADIVEGAKFTMQFDVYKFGTAWSQWCYVVPFANSIESTAGMIQARVNNVSQFTSVPAGTTITIGDAEPVEIVADGATIYNSTGYFLNNIYPNGYTTFWYEFDVAGKSMTVYGGNAEANVKTKYSVFNNVLTLDETADGYYMKLGMNLNLEIDNFKVYRTLDNDTKTYADYDFEDTTKITNNSGENNKLFVFHTSGAGSSAVKMYDSLIIVTNPKAETKISTLNPLKVTDTFEPTVEITAGFRLNVLPKGVIVGIAFGLNYYDDPINGAVLIGFTLKEVDAPSTAADEGEPADPAKVTKVYLGAYNISSDGTSASPIKEVELEGLTVGDTNIMLKMSGKTNGSIDVTVNDAAEPINFEGVNLNGCLAFTHFGTGNLTYSLLTDAFDVVGYELTENEVTETVSATFDGGYIDANNKFAMQPNTAPDGFYDVQETTKFAQSVAGGYALSQTGIVANNGKVGFYATSTNARLMFKNQYTDFVMQFDYTSSSQKERILPSGLNPANASGNKILSPFYVIFGAENDIPEVGQAYVLGIVEGCGSHHMYGAESLLNAVGASKFPENVVKVLNDGYTKYEVGADNIPEDAIHAYASATDEYWFTPNPGEGQYSFYNKTTRMKLVVVNNRVKLYVAEVKTDNTVDDYMLVYETKVDCADGYVGFGTDAPGWAEIDNVAVTPIAKERVLEVGLKGAIAADIVPDIAVADMESDLEPTNLERPVVTVDEKAKKATWNAVDGAKQYDVKVTLNNVKKLEKTVTTTEVDLSELTEVGEYSVIVTAVAADQKLHYDTNSKAVKYTVKKKGGCRSSVEAMLWLAPAAIAAAAAVMLKKRNED